MGGRFERPRPPQECPKRPPDRSMKFPGPEQVAGGGKRRGQKHHFWYLGARKVPKPSPFVPLGRGKGTKTINFSTLGQRANQTLYMQSAGLKSSGEVSNLVATSSASQAPGFEQLNQTYQKWRGPQHYFWYLRARIVPKPSLFVPLEGPKV